jgi:glycerol-3-phosphate acyltransferase PlsY
LIASTGLGSTPLAVAVTVVAGYLLGSIPVAVLVARARGVDVRRVGDGNPGYWNAKEALGRRAALPVFVGDVAKGAAGSTVLTDADFHERIA